MLIGSGLIFALAIVVWVLLFDPFGKQPKNN
jgi:hypothetical protein